MQACSFVLSTPLYNSFIHFILARTAQREHLPCGPLAESESPISQTVERLCERALPPPDSMGRPDSARKKGK